LQAVLKKKRKNWNSAGLSAVHFVMAELFRTEGCIPVMTEGNTRGIDIILASSRGDRIIKSLQVKGTKNFKNSKPYWRFTQIKPEFVNDNLLFVFVYLGSENPEYYVVPSKIVFEDTEAGHRNWLNTPRKDGSERITKFNQVEFPYRANLEEYRGFSRIKVLVPSSE